MSQRQSLWFDAPAGADWNRALPIGNGFLGAMVFGNIVSDRLSLNEDSIWSGGPRERHNPDAPSALLKVRQALRDGRHGEACAHALDGLSGIPDSMRHYEPLADLLIRLEHPDLPVVSHATDFSRAESYVSSDYDSGLVTDYRRELDLQNALLIVQYKIGHHAYRREYFASAVDDVIVMRLETDSPTGLNIKSRLERGPRSSFSSRFSDGCWCSTAPPMLGLWGGTGGEGGLRFACALGVSCDGEVSAVGETLSIQRGRTCTFVFAAASSFRAADPQAITQERVRQALAQEYLTLRDSHIREYRSLFARVDLQLGAAESDLPIDQRLALTPKCGLHPSLISLYFQFGRYLLISSSRPGSLPANLQGIWNQDFWPAWGSKYTLNINLPMNYWGAEIANLPECHVCLLDFVERLVESGQETARRMYGARGFVVHHNTDIWADTCPTDRNLAASYWCLGGAWLALHFWEHFRFAPQRDRLLRAYAVLKPATEFLLDVLIDGIDGRLVLSPSASPENVYRRADGSLGVLVQGCQMDVQIAEQLFRCTLEAAELLEADSELRNRIRGCLSRLPVPQIGNDGRLMEWLEDVQETDPQHRHVSHLFALYPGDGISPRRTPELAHAAKASLVQRGDAGTGWCMVWKAALWGRLGNGHRVFELLTKLLSPAISQSPDKLGISHSGGGSYPNLFCAHPPFQIDGNLGAVAVIAELFLQGHEGETGEGPERCIPVIHLLPALPDCIPSGHVAGLRARGGFCVSISWEDGKLTECEISSSGRTSCRVCWQARSRLVRFEKAEKVRLSSAMLES